MQHTWGPGGLNSSFQDTGQGLEEDAQGLGPQGLWTEDRDTVRAAPQPEANWLPSQHAQQIQAKGRCWGLDTTLGNSFPTGTMIHTQAMCVAPHGSC